MLFSSRGEAKSAEIHAVVIRADGRREDLGRISFWHRNPLVRAWWHIQAFFRAHL
jgi:hypothetical protein